MTSEAIQDAFVLLLLEKGHDATSMRDIARLAGVGLGTLYLYFPNKDSIAAVTVRRWVRRLTTTLQEANARDGARTLRRTVDDLATTYARIFLDQPAQWRALIPLERRISSLESHREIYRLHAAMVREALVASSDWPALADADTTALTVFTIVDGMARSSLLFSARLPTQEALVRDMQCAVNGYLNQIRDAAAATPDQDACSAT